VNPLLAAALEMERFFRARRWRFCIIGGLAVVRWGSPRATEDVDISLLTGLGNEARIVERILKDFAPRSDDAGAFALESRVLLITPSNRTSIDVALTAYPFEEEIIQRASKYQFAKGVRLTTASAEDCILMKAKAIASRSRDWQDIRDIAEAQSQQLEWDYIERQLVGLSEAIEADDLITRLKDVRRQTE
jgi:hypothetical protein